MHNKDLLILIPCRKGSKGILNKNVLKVKKKLLYELYLPKFGVYGITCNLDNNFYEENIEVDNFDSDNLRK